MSKQSIEIDSLYQLNNEEFLRKAFLVLLNREVDEYAFEFYLDKIHKGVISRTSIIHQIINSNEFSQDKSAIVNNNKLLELSQFLSKPLFGKPFKQYGRPIRILDKKINNFIKWRENFLVTQSPSNFTHVETSNSPIIVQDPLNENIINELTKKLITLESSNIRNQKILSNLNKQLALSNNTNSKIYLNLTTTKRWRSRVVGIVKAERELANFMYQNVDNIVFFIWNENKQDFFEMPLALVQEILSDTWMDSSQNVMDIKDEYFTQKLNLTKNDILISLGLDWDNNLTEKIYNLKQASNCKVILACYDLIPILYPEHTVAANFKQLFQKHFVDMFHTADLIWAISNNTKKDLLSFWQDKCMLNIAAAPSIEVILLGADMAHVDSEDMSEFEKGQLRHILSLGNYTMYVSSFESRKNHKILLDIWREGYQEYGDEWPTLVIVGRHGWGVDELISHMNRMLATRAGKIIWLNNASDALLEALYEQVNFTLFPSLYEGWGLAAAESLEKGKPCIVSDNSSLMEATQGLMPAYHPLDYPSWKAAIEKMIFDLDHMNKLKKEINSNYQSQTWKDFSENFLRHVELLSQKSDLANKETSIIN